MKIGNIGNKLDLQFRHGATFGPYQITLKNQDATSVNLTGCLFSGNISKTNSVFTDVVPISFSIIDPIAGIISMSITKENTSLLKGNPDVTPEFIYDTIITFADGHVEPLFYGDVYVKSSV